MAKKSRKRGRPPNRPSGRATSSSATSASTVSQRQPATGGQPGFINPYNFVRWASPDICRDVPRTHEKFAGLSGRVVVELTTITPLCIPDPKGTDILCMISDQPRLDKPFLRVDDKPYIPGTALKGMLRSVAEAVSNSCYLVFTENMAVFRDNRRHVPISRGVGNLTQKPDDSLQLDNPAPGNPVTSVQFQRRGLFDQQARRYRPRANNPKASGQDIPNEIRDLYQNMVNDDSFTCDEQQPDSRQRQWLLDFGSNQPWWFRETDIRDRRSKTYQQKVITFGRNFRYKWGYDPKQALPKPLHPCTEPHHLCPCCALFGMVEQRDDEASQREAQVKALAGKVAVGPARWSDGNCDFEMVDDHKILGSPKFSCRSFYLNPSDWNLFNVSEDEFVSMNAIGEIVPNFLRGRKFYWHHTKLWADKRNMNYIERLPYNRRRPDETAQNARIEVLLPEAKFEFTIEFENLSDWELGLLLWTIELPDVPEGAQHLGLGKPIGLGTVTLKIKQIEMIDRNRRYSELFATGVEEYETRDINLSNTGGQFGDYVQAFRKQMTVWNNGIDFQQLPNVNDLKVILSRQQPACAQLTDVPITYPLGDDPGKQSGRQTAGNVHPSELNYKWFCEIMKWKEPLVTIQQIGQGEYQKRR